MALRKEIFPTPFAEYAATEVIGNGGSGVVYKVQDDNGAILALKAIDPNKATRQRIKRFKNEIFFCLKTDHRNIVKVFDWGFISKKDTQCPFYVMPYYPATLRSLMRSGISVENVLPLFAQILDGTECAHLLGVFHRDLKPENILYDPSQKLLILCDFGIAHFSEEALHTAVETRDTERLANFQYAAPEQRTKGGKVDSRADIYSLGLILNEMFTGHCPSGTGFKKVVDAAPNFAYVDTLVDVMLQQAQDARPQTVARVKDNLIGAKNEFVSRQRLSELKKQVVSTTEVDDRLVLVPPQLSEVDYKKGRLVFRLSSEPSRDWIQTFQSIGNYTALMGYEPSMFQFLGDEASISSPESLAQALVDHFKDYLAQTHLDYKTRKVAERKRDEEQRRRALQQETEEEERRQRVRRNLKL
jgi:serine/threonine protein kinase